MTFELDEQLANDTVAVGDLPLSRVLLMNDCRFPWLILAPRRAGLADFHDLGPEDRAILAEETAIASAALQKLAGADKMNVASLGNVVRQLHVHVIARRTDDDAWPRPVWGVGEAVPYAEGEAEACATLVRQALGL